MNGKVSKQPAFRHNAPLWKGLLYFSLHFLLLFIQPSFAANYQKAFDALNSGDFATALKEYEVLAAQGHTAAQYDLGVMYRDGIGVP